MALIIYKDRNYNLTKDSPKKDNLYISLSNWKNAFCKVGERGAWRVLLKPGGGSRGGKHLRPGLRTAYAEGGRTSQGPEHCPSRPLASLFRALPIRGSPAFEVSRS